MFDLIPTELVIACLWNLMFDSSIGGNILMFDSVISLLVQLMLMVVSFSYFGHFFSSNLGHWIQ